MKNLPPPYSSPTHKVRGGGEEGEFSSELRLIECKILRFYYPLPGKFCI